MEEERRLLDEELEGKEMVIEDWLVLGMNYSIEQGSGRSCDACCSDWESVEAVEACTSGIEAWAPRESLGKGTDSALVDQPEIEDGSTGVVVVLARVLGRDRRVEEELD